MYVYIQGSSSIQELEVKFMLFPSKWNLIIFVALVEVHLHVCFSSARGKVW